MSYLGFCHILFSFDTANNIVLFYWSTKQLCSQHQAIQLFGLLLFLVLRENKKKSVTFHPGMLWSITYGRMYASPRFKLASLDNSLTNNGCVGDGDSS